MRTIHDLAEWTEWIPFAEATVSAPRCPGVYLARSDGEVVYVGKAGLRDRGGTSTPQGLRGRLARYASGKAISSGLGEAVMDRALADPSWIQQRLDELASGQPKRAFEWGREAFARADLQVCWTTTGDAAAAHLLERQVIALLAPRGSMWNRTG